MVLDLQDVNATLEDAVAKSQIRLFGSSSRPLAVQAEAGPSSLPSSGGSSGGSGSEGEEDYSEVEGDEEDFSGEDEGFASEEEMDDDLKLALELSLAEALSLEGNPTRENREP